MLSAAVGVTGARVLCPSGTPLLIPTDVDGTGLGTPEEFKVEQLDAGWILPRLG